MSTALFIGRFQPLHKGHVQIIKKLLKEFDEVIIAVGSSQFKNTMNNPFSLDERTQMIKLVFGRSHYKIIPIKDTGRHKSWVKNIKRIKADKIFTGNKWVLKHFDNVIPIVHELNISASLIRELISNNQPWKNLVPLRIFNYLKKLNVKKRIKIIQKNLSS